MSLFDVQFICAKKINWEFKKFLEVCSVHVHFLCLSLYLLHLIVQNKPIFMEYIQWLNYSIIFLPTLVKLYDRTNSGGNNKNTIWKRPLMVKGPLGIVSTIELTFFIMFIALLVWSLSNYLSNGFSKITKDSAAKSGDQVYIHQLYIYSLYIIILHPFLNIICV